LKIKIDILTYNKAQEEELLVPNLTICISDFVSNHKSKKKDETDSKSEEDDELTN